MYPSTMDSTTNGMPNYIIAEMYKAASHYNNHIYQIIDNWNRLLGEMNPRVYEIEKKLDRFISLNKNEVMAEKKKFFKSSKFTIDLYSINYIRCNDEILTIHIVDKAVDYVFENPEEAKIAYQALEAALMSIT